MSPIPSTPSAPAVSSQPVAKGVALALSGDWTLDTGARMEAGAARLVGAAKAQGAADLDCSGIATLDTAGAWILDRSRQELLAQGVDARFTGVQPEHRTLLEAAHYRPAETRPAREGSVATALLADIGESMVIAARDLAAGLDFLGRVMAVGLRGLVNVRSWRVTSFVYHVESFGLRGAPIIVMINFFVGAIVAEQGIFQLARFGASSFTVDLVGILTLREMGVLLTSIMVAGRSGSAITAEIGAMKMREEIDAMRVMALDPLDVLILPRLSALVVSLPMLTLLGDLSALFGGMCVTWAYAGISPLAFVIELQSKLSLERFEVGLIKAPFMALVIGIIAAGEGFAVSGSAESLGKKVTESVVKSIFMVIVLDGLFAMFFTAVRF